MLWPCSSVVLFDLAPGQIGLRKEKHLCCHVGDKYTHNSVHRTFNRRDSIIIFLIIICDKIRRRVVDSIWLEAICVCMQNVGTAKTTLFKGMSTFLYMQHCETKRIHSQQQRQHQKMRERLWKTYERLELNDSSERNKKLNFNEKGEKKVSRASLNPTVRNNKLEFASFIRCFDRLDI